MSTSPPDVHSAYAAHDWDRVLEILSGPEQGSTLTADDLLLKADAFYWTGRFDDAIEAFEQAHSKFAAEGRPGEAGLVAALLAYFAVRRQSFSVGRAWLTRAHQMLDDAPDSLGHAWLKLLHIGIALFSEGDLPRALEGCDDAIAFAESIGSPSSQSIAMSFKGLAMTQTENWREGLELMDQAMLVAIAGGDDLRMTSDVYCNTISVCRNLGDYRRAEEWTEEAERWMRANAVTGYTGACQVHRAELKLFHGHWTEAENEARKACEELARYQLVDYLGAAHHGIGEVRRRMGDLDTAQREFEQAYASDHDAQPGISLLMRDRGDVQGALESIEAAAIRRGSGEHGAAWRGPSRARLLPALVEIALDAGDVDLADSAAEEMAEIAEAFDSALWRAQSAACRGSVALAKGDVEAAARLLDSARTGFRALDLPYEMALSQSLLADAHGRAGDERTARLDLIAARDIFRDLGAVPDLDRVNDRLDQADRSHASAERVTRTFVFTDIVKSTDLIEIIGDESWTELLRWHDRTIKASIERNSGEVVNHTGDGFFAAFSDPRRAIDSAVEIQRVLRKHRSDSGFALLVRIGIHQAEATFEKGDYSGGGVHVAARIAAAAGAEQIVVSTATIEAAGPLPYSNTSRRFETLKGVSEPVEVCEVDWA